MDGRLLGIVIVAAGAIAGGAQAGTIAAVPESGKPQVRLLDGGGAEQSTFWATAAPNVAGVALADVDGDGRRDIVAAAGAGGRPEVVALSGEGDPIRSFLAAAPSWGGGASVAAGDLTGDGRAELVTAANGEVAAWSTVTGAKLWSTTIAGDDEPRVAVGAGLVAGAGVVLDANGKRISSYGATGYLALGDVDGDGSPEVVVGADGSGPQVQVFDARTGALRASLQPFDASVTSVAVAVADVAGDARLEIVVGAVIDGIGQVRAVDLQGREAGWTASARWGTSIALGGGAGEVAVAVGNWYDGRVVVLGRDGGQRASVEPFAEPAGTEIALGDVDHDGNVDVVTAPAWGQRPLLRVFDRSGNLRRVFDAFDPVLRNGISLATGDVDGDGFADIVAAPASGGVSSVHVLDGRTGQEIASFDAFPRGAYVGTRVAAGDVVGDGAAEVVVGAASGAPEVKLFSRTGRLISSFLAFDPGSTYGVSVAAGDVFGEGRDAIVVASAAGNQVRVFRTIGIPASSFTVPDLCCGLRVATADLDGDGAAEILVSAPGAQDGRVEAFRPDGTRVADLRAFPGYTGPVALAGIPRVHRVAPRLVPPSRPTIRGPRWTRKRSPVFRFHSIDYDGPDADVRYRCAFDRSALHACRARYAQRLTPGRHRLRVLAVDGDGARSQLATAIVVSARRG